MTDINCTLRCSRAWLMSALLLSFALVWVASQKTLRRADFALQMTQSQQTPETVVLHEPRLSPSVNAQANLRKPEGIDEQTAPTTPSASTPCNSTIPLTTSPPCNVTTATPCNATKRRVLTLYTVLAGTKYDNTRVIMNRMRYSSLFPKESGIIIKPIIQLQPTAQHPSWQKIAEYPFLANSSDYVWFLDADAFIMADKNIFDVIDRYSKEKDCDLYFAADPNGLNGGSFIVRTSPWSEKFMQRVYSLRNDATIPHISYWWEQAVFHKLLPEIQDHVCMASQKEINAYPEIPQYGGFRGRMRFWEKGDLVIHSPGHGFQTLVEYMARAGVREV